ncbi:mCG141834, partial [Mus musculus]
QRYPGLQSNTLSRAWRTRSSRSSLTAPWFGCLFEGTLWTPLKPHCVHLPPSPPAHYHPNSQLLFTAQALTRSEHTQDACWQQL